jgi:hypothetical protein
MMDDLTQGINAHPDFFIPLNLTLPQEDVDACQSHVISTLRELHKSSTRLWFNSAAAAKHPFTATQNLANEFLEPLGLKADVMGVFIVNPNRYDRNIHADSAMLETRLNFYELAEAPGVVRWFPDTGDGYKSYNKNLDGIEFLDYTWPWVEDFKRNKLPWSVVPAPVHATATTCTSAFVRTDLPHHVIQGNGLRVTVTCRVVDKETGSTTGTWARLKEQFTSLCQ